MASPFAMFRRNQQTLLVVLFILAIFAFTLSDLLVSQTPNLPMLGLIIGTCVMTAVGVKFKQPAKYAVIGAFGGLLIGYAGSFFVSPGGPNAIAKTDIGSISQADVQRMLQNRTAANQFIMYAAQQALGSEQAMAQAQGYSFGITPNVDEEEAVLSYLMLEEAKRLGIYIDKDAVTDFINRVTDNKLSRTAYGEVLKSIQVTDSQIYQILQEQLTIQTAMRRLQPTGFVTPMQFWDIFEKLNVSQKIQTVAVPVAVMAETIPEPEDSVLQAFFEAHKADFPGDPDPDSVGFRQPRKIQLAYIEANYLDLEATIPEITDEEIKKFYDDNKDPLYLNRVFPDDPFGGDLFPEGTGGTTGPDTGQTDTPGPTLDLDSLTPDTGKPPGSEAPLKADKSPSSEPGKDNDSGAPNDQPELPQLPDPKDNPESGESKPQSSIDRSNPAFQPVSFLQEEKETDKPEPPAETEKPETKATAADDGKSANETSDEPTDKPSDSEESSAESKTIPPAPETALEAPLRAPRPAPPKFKPLDDLLRDEIRDRLLREKTAAKQSELATKVLDRMTKLSDEYFDLEKPEQKQAFIDDTQTELQELADELGLNYELTDLMSGSELSLSTEHPIGSASLGMELSNLNQESVTQHVFNLPPESVYEANAARSLDPDSIYVFWKTADRAAHIPQWDEKGIREDVLEAWKSNEARPKAKARADELLERLDDVEEPWSEYFISKPETVTGEDDGVLLQAILSDSFTWMSRVRSSVPTQFGFDLPMEVPELTDLNTIENEGEKFMETVFKQMQPGDVKVVPNSDLSVYYVVQVRDRRPSNPTELEIQRERFLRDEIFPTSFFPTPYSFEINQQNGRLYRAWLDDLKHKYGVEIYQRDEPGS